MKIYIIDGIDKVGKTTFAKTLSKHLIETVRSKTNNIKKIIKTSSSRDLEEFFAACRTSACLNILKISKKKMVDIICVDRLFVSGIIYGKKDLLNYRKKIIKCDIDFFARTMSKIANSNNAEIIFIIAKTNYNNYLERIKSCEEDDYAKKLTKIQFDETERKFISAQELIIEMVNASLEKHGVDIRAKGKSIEL